MCNNTWEQVIKVHPSAPAQSRWIGIDLNTTGHVAVAADPKSGNVMKLGKNVNYVHSQSSKNCTKLYKEGKLWKIKKCKSRERKAFKVVLSKISRQIVSFAELAGSGIRFEKLFSGRYSHSHDAAGFIEFSFSNGSFLSLQRQVERRADEKGIPVQYVNPAYTSKRCSRCGEFGRRYRKHFECPHCGFVANADVNAAFNIALARGHVAHLAAEDERMHDGVWLTRKEIRRLVREELFEPHPGILSASPGPLAENLLAVLE